MARDSTEGGSVEFSGKVSREEYDRFIARFPQHGATTWFIRTALRSFNDAVENDPSCVERIQHSIMGILQE